MKTTRLLRLPAVMEMTGLGRDTIYKLIRAGSFPPPRKITDRSSAWSEFLVRCWIDSRPVGTLGRVVQPRDTAAQ